MPKVLAKKRHIEQPRPYDDMEIHDGDPVIEIICIGRYDCYGNCVMHKSTLRAVQPDWKEYVNSIDEVKNDYYFKALKRIRYSMQFMMNVVMCAKDKYWKTMRALLSDDEPM